MRPATHKRNRGSVAILLTFSIILGIVSCQKEEAVLPLLASGFDGKTALIIPSGTISIKFNQRITWKLSAGIATQNAQDSLVYTAPKAVGKQRITVKSERNADDSLVINVIVTPRAEVLRLLQKGGYVLVFRHALADVGSDQTNSTEANWWKSCDSKLARQLNDRGKKDAVDIGKALKNLQIPVGRAFTSEYCRCYTTTELMNLGVVAQQSKDLTYFVYDEANRYTTTMNVVNKQPIDAQNSVMVIHAGFTVLPTPAPLNALLWGDAAIFQLLPGQSARYVATVEVTEWTELAL